jgi:hypothetical protein
MSKMVSPREALDAERPSPFFVSGDLGDVDDLGRAMVVEFLPRGASAALDAAIRPRPLTQSKREASAVPR